MDLEQIDRIAFQAMGDRRDHRDREPGWIYYHGRRTAGLALRLCDDLGIRTDRDALHAGALFHDIGKGSRAHHETGAARARRLLKDACTPAELDFLCDLILRHNQRGLRADFSDAVRVLQDADVLDHVGVIGPWMSFYWCGRHGESVREHIRFFQGEENRTGRRVMIESLNFDLARRLFAERIAFEDEFFSRFHRFYLEGV